MSQLDKVYNYLCSNNDGPGVTVARITKFTGVPKANVYKRVSDLRGMGHRIYSNTRIVNGRPKLYYRAA